MLRHGKRWTTSDVEALRALIAGGNSARVVADVLGRTMDAVQGKASNLGVSWKKAQASPPLLRARFLRSVTETSSCHMWSGPLYTNGYGQFSINNRHHLAHRIAWTMAKGTIPDGLFVCHRCDQKACVNPDHLFLGTHNDNMRDMHEKGRQAQWHVIAAETVAAIRAAVGSQRSISNRYGVSQSYVSLLRAGKHRREAA